ncbi:MAG: PQQ-binding-like beta-propeller repeat protein [Fimbriimonas sp.]
MDRVNADFPAPPYRRRWTIQVDHSIDSTLVQGSTLYVLTGTSLTAIDLREGKVRWQTSLGHYASDGIFATERGLFVLSYSSPRLIELDPATGAMCTHPTGRRPKMLGDGGLVLWEGDDGQVVLYDIRRGKPRLELAGLTDLPYYQAVADGGVAFGDFGTVSVYDLDRGTKRWEAEADRLLGIASGIVVTEFSDRLQGRDFETGRRIWERWVPRRTAEGTVIQERLFVIEEAGTLELDPTSGEELWRHVQRAKRPHGIPSHRDGPKLFVVGDAVFFEATTTYVLDAKGNERWTTPKLHGLAPVWTDGDTLVMRDDRRLFGYTSGEVEPDRADEDALDILTGTYSELDYHERAELFGRIHQDSDRILAHWVDLDRRYHLPAKPDGLDIDALQDLTKAVAKPEIVPAMLDTLRRMRYADGHRRAFFDIIRQLPHPIVGTFAADLLDWEARDFRDELHPWRDTSELSLLPIILDNPSQRAFQVVFDLLEDPAISCFLRNRIFNMLGAMGPEGIERALHIKRTSRLIPEFWPGVARRAETDFERALEAVFEARFMFCGQESGHLSFPKGIEPFAMVGAKAVCFTRDSEEESRGSEISYYFRLEPIRVSQVGHLVEEIPFEIKNDYEDGEKLSIGFGCVTGPRSGGGVETVILKVADQWVPVGTGRIWIH